ncbi:Probable serine/threonine-protein kinase MPS1 homolog, partial [Geodia barretti]
MTAKIADLGMARIMPPKIKATMTKAPGAYIYMPPEALEDVSKYNTSIDIFSLGVLIIFVLAETFPDNPKAPNYTDEVKGLLARTELQRRENYTEKLYREFTKTHPLIQLMESCLENMPKRRPTIDGVQQILGQAAALVQGEAQLHKLQLLQMLKEKEEQLQKYLTDESKECEQMRQILAEERAINARMEEANRELQVQLEATTDERSLQAIRDRVERYMNERDQLKVAVSQYQERDREQQETIHSIQMALEEATAQNSNQDSTGVWQDQVASLTLQLEESNKRMLRYREERNTARIMHKSFQEQINTLQATVEQLQNSRSYDTYTSGQL